MSAMTASGSNDSTSKQPHTIQLPPSPTKTSLQQNSNKKRRGKEKEKEGNAPPSRGVRQDEWDHRKAGTQDWQWVSLTDSSASKHPPIFTKDGRYTLLVGWYFALLRRLCSYFFAIAGSSIKIYSCATGQIISTLAGKPDTSPSDMITSAVLNPTNPFQLITGSLDGYIRIWDFLDAILLQTISLEQPIFHLCAHENFPDYVFVAVTKPTKNSNGNGMSSCP
jgi:NET1-associated nuclear protein 1 (U3 small nucleolar RNA-associated protein 17)